MKAIVLTPVNISNEEQKLLINTDIYKIAVNQHCEHLNPNIRICADWTLDYLIHKFKQTIISIRDRVRYKSNRIKYPEIEFKGATIISAVEYLLREGYDNILIVGDNTVNTKRFQDNVNKHISEFASNSKIYQFAKGNFDLPTKSIKEFINNGE